ncbi:MAG: pyridoxal-phosphate dependent enzyme, partial [Chloroflexi bacterium]|nr:pyridoxal-phosphate dependent enzyme [Chloroflexota bacterium]
MAVNHNTTNTIRRGERPEIAESALDLVGNTPLVRLNRVVPAGVATVLGKLENLNPAGSVKDRIALSMVEAAERAGRLKPGDTIVEPTSARPMPVFPRVGTTIVSPGLRQPARSAASTH